MSCLKSLNQPITIGGIRIKNRIVMPPMDTNYANADGSFSRKGYAYLTERAKGGAGLIIVEATSVSYPEGKISERQLNMKSAVTTPEIHDLVDSVHGFGTKIIPQIHHGGFMAVPDYCNGIQSVSASDYMGARALSTDEIKQIEQDFIHAATIAKNAGFDGVEVHGCHMYLLNQFLSPISNTRTDAYGGSLENRFRLLGNILRGIRKVCPRPFLLSVRLAAVDACPGGITLEEGIQFAKWCEECGADMLNLSNGFYTSVSQSTESQWEPEANRVYMSEAVKKEVHIPVSIVGKLRTPELCAEIIETGKTDMVCIGRQLICDPYFPNKIFTGRLDEIRPCLNCDDGCLGQFYYNHGNVHCSINPYVGYEDMYNEVNVPKAGIAKKIVVVGGGIAGMQCAITLKKRGHDVTIIEKEDKLGGQMYLAASTPFKESVGSAVKWFVSEVDRLKIRVCFHTQASVESIEKMDPDVVVLATGSLPNTPPIPGINSAIDSWDVLKGAASIEKGAKVVMIGGGVVGSELAHKLIDEGNAVTILEMMSELCRGHEAMHREKLENYMRENASVKLNVQVTQIGEHFVKYRNEGKEEEIAADYVVYSVGQHPIGEELFEGLLDKGKETYKIGDCQNPANFRAATRAALDLAYRI